MLNLMLQIACTGIAYHELTLEFERKLNEMKPRLIAVLGGNKVIDHINFYHHTPGNFTVVYAVRKTPYKGKYRAEYRYNLHENEWQHDLNGDTFKFKYDIIEDQAFLKEMLNILNSKE